jgi:predicted acetyltransferase
MSQVELIPATAADYACIENMMQFYCYDFSEYLLLPLNAAGMFTLSPKAEYWAKPATQAFLIRVDGEMAGFVTVDDEIEEPGAEHNIGYFWVSRAFKGQGVGREVVRQLLARISGEWQVFYIKANLGAAGFWGKVIPVCTRGNFTRLEAVIDDWDCVVYRFFVTE